jgi:hypothetical protein
MVPSVGDRRQTPLYQGRTGSAQATVQAKVQVWGIVAHPPPSSLYTFGIKQCNTNNNVENWIPSLFSQPNLESSPSFAWTKTPILPTSPTQATRPQSTRQFHPRIFGTRGSVRVQANVLVTSVSIANITQAPTLYVVGIECRGCFGT